jgi:hypothetical protein
MLEGDCYSEVWGDSTTYAQAISFSERGDQNISATMLDKNFDPQQRITIYECFSETNCKLTSTSYSFQMHVQGRT